MRASDFSDAFIGNILIMDISVLSETCIESVGNICLFSLRNTNGTTVKLTNWGASLVSIDTVDNKGSFSNILLGYSGVVDYMQDSYYMGAVIGPFANRICGGKFSIDGKSYFLDCNDGANTNHSGSACIGRKRWEWEILDHGLCFSILSPHLDGGFPGNLLLKVIYSLTENDELVIDYYATTDVKTYVNLTNHAYFNLGNPKEKISTHWLQINASKILETDATFIPTGQCVSVDGTPFDFSFSHPIGDFMFDINNQQIRWNRGYNHYYILNCMATPRSLIHAASLFYPSNGKRVDVFTDYPGMLLYTSGYYCIPDTGVCFETQYFPDTPSHAHFPSCLLNPGNIYRHKTVFKFSIN